MDIDRLDDIQIMIFWYLRKIVFYMKVNSVLRFDIESLFFLLWFEGLVEWKDWFR